MAAIVIIGWILQALVYLVTVVHAYATMGWVGTIMVSRTLFCHATTTRQNHKGNNNVMLLKKKYLKKFLYLNLDGLST